MSRDPASQISRRTLPLNPFINQPKGGPVFWQLLLRSQQNRATLHKLIVVTVIMICAPLFTFFATRSYLFYDYNASDQLVYSGLAAVVMVNVVSFGFVIFAWFLDSDATEEEFNEKDAPSAPHKRKKGKKGPKKS